MKRLIDEAEGRMRAKVDAETVSINNGIEIEGIDFNRYEAARKMFEEALRIDPGNERATRGIADCDEMLRAYVPVQHVARLDRPIDPSLLEPLDAGPGTAPGKPPSKTMPWEAMRERRRRDREDDAYTGAVFGKAREEAEAKVNAIVEAAVERAKKNPGAAHTIRDAAANQIEALQRQLHQGWKGHGPEIRDAALGRLNDAFKQFPA